MDLVVRNAGVVTAAGRGLTDIGILNGRVRQMGGPMSANREIDAQGKIVTPGGVDAHVHLTPPSRVATDVKWSDDFESGSARWTVRACASAASMTCLDARIELVPAFWVPPVIGPWVLRRKMAEEARRTSVGLEVMARASRAQVDRGPGTTLRERQGTAPDRAAR